MNPYEPRPAGRHIRSPDGKLVRDGEFTDPNATAAPAAEEPSGERTSTEPTTPPKKGGK